MSEDVSSQVRLGATIIIVAALIAAVLSLLVVAQTILTSGMSTLQAGVDQIQLQEYEKYNSKKVSGTEVKSALSLYSGKDVSIIIRTRACIEGKAGNAYAFMYGTLLTNNPVNMPPNYKTTAGETTEIYCVERKLVGSDDSSSIGTTANDAAGKPVLWKIAGESSYTSYLCTQNDIVQVSFETKGITTVGDPQYVLDSSRFRSNLIKSPDGTIIGIFFEQLN